MTRGGKSWVCTNSLITAPKCHTELSRIFFELFKTLFKIMLKTIISLQLTFVICSFPGKGNDDAVPGVVASPQNNSLPSTPVRLSTPDVANDDWVLGRLNEAQHSQV